jgi:hypothetical protein
MGRAGLGPFFGTSLVTFFRAAKKRRGWSGQTGPPPSFYDNPDRPGFAGGGRSRRSPSEPEGRPGGKSLIDIVCSENCVNSIRHRLLTLTTATSSFYCGRPRPTPHHDRPADPPVRRDRRSAVSRIDPVPRSRPYGAPAWPPRRGRAVPAPAPGSPGEGHPWNSVPAWAAALRRCARKSSGRRSSEARL